jgi:hypothetical protein
MIFRSALRTIPVTAALLGAAMFSSPTSVIAAASQEVSANFIAENAITSELKELRGLTSQLDNYADQLHSLTNSPGLHWRTHASRLTTVKHHVNRIGDQLEVLQAMRLSAAPWQQEAIDNLVTAALQVAGHTTSAIDHLNGSRHLWAPEYVDHLRAIAALSDHMHELVDNHLKIIDAQSEIQSLEDKLAERVS